ncbi:MAG TPA: hypothetical protein VFP84_14175, partial [Kofleriaceae bacterium]|nr:hypothetical protein [Kofleriaceae bacterium]
IALAGGERAIAPAARAVPGRLRWIYAGTAAITDDADETSPREPRWHRASQPEVWLWLELPPGALPPGAIDAAITLDGAPREPRAIAPAAVRHAASGALRLPLWVDPQLTGERARTTEQSRGRMIDHFEITIRSQAAVAREVWFEEDLRPFPRHVVHVGARPTTARDHVALPLTVGGAAVVHDQLAIDYELLP